MTPIGSIDRQGNQLEQGLYMHQASSRAALVTRVDGNSNSTNYFPNTGGNRVPSRYLTPVSPEFTSWLLQQEDFIIWLNGQTRGKPDLEKAVRRSLRI